jgi:hypothetical protein
MPPRKQDDGPLWNVLPFPAFDRPAETVPPREPLQIETLTVVQCEPVESKEDEQLAHLSAFVRDLERLEEEHTACSKAG